MSQKVKIKKDPRRFSMVLAKETRCASDHLSLSSWYILGNPLKMRAGIKEYS